MIQEKVQIDFSTARAVCNDANNGTWEVIARADNGISYTISDSQTMTREQAARFAIESQMANLKYEVKVHGDWVEVTLNIFRS